MSRIPPLWLKEPGISTLLSLWYPSPTQRNRSSPSRISWPTASEWRAELKDSGSSVFCSRAATDATTMGHGGHGSLDSTASWSSGQRRQSLVVGVGVRHETFKGQNIGFGKESDRSIFAQI